MKDQTEIIVLVVVLVLIYTRPSALVRFSSTFIGKLILLVAVVLSSLVSPLSGLLIATLMVLYSEQNYEGFVEGVSSPNPEFIIKEDYNTGSTEMLIQKNTDVAVDVDISNWTTSTHDIISVDPAMDLFDKHTKITDAYKAFMIHLKADASVAITNLPPGNIIIDIYQGDDTKLASGEFTRSDESSISDISQFMISNDELTYESGKTRLDILSTSSGGNLVNGYIKISNAADDVDTKYLINYIDHVISVSFSSGINSPITGGSVDAGIRQVQIVEHSHTHGHVDGFEGMDGEETAEKEIDEKEDEEDDETKDAVKNIMDKLDIAGIIDTVKKESDKTEGFFSGERESGNEVAGAFAGESYESEITGVAECTTTICERIHREEQLIRPVNSNEELQRV